MLVLATALGSLCCDRSPTCCREGDLMKARMALALSGLGNLQPAGELGWGAFPTVWVTKEADAGVADVALPRVSKKTGLKMLPEVERV